MCGWNRRYSNSCRYFLIKSNIPNALCGLVQLHTIISILTYSVSIDNKWNITDSMLSSSSQCIHNTYYQLCWIFFSRYTVLREPTKNWGIDTDGVWNGVLGYVQREDVDMSTFMVPLPASLKVATFMRSTPTGSAVIVSLKAQPLPRYLAFIRPFTGISIDVSLWDHP